MISINCYAYRLMLGMVYYFNSTLYCANVILLNKKSFGIFSFDLSKLANAFQN